MEPREKILYYALKYRGDWDKIYADLSSGIDPDEKEALELNKTVASNYITILDEIYPDCLRRTPKAPFILFYHGDISLIEESRQKIAVVGSRKYSTYGADMTKKLVGEICKDFIIVSGMALGIDSIAHRTAIDNGGRTIAVLGCGINVCYLKSSLDIYENCKEKNLVISEYPNDVPPCPMYFPIRNRIIAGLTDNLLVTEGKVNSGTQITAMLVSEKAGNVCCVPTRAGEDSVCNYMIAHGAYLVETADDIYAATGRIYRKPIFE